MPQPFEYRPYQPQSLAALASLVGAEQRAKAQSLREAAMIRSRELEIGGQAKANMAGTIGATLQSLAQIPMQRQQQRAADEEHALRMRGLTANVTGAERNLEAQDAAAQQAAALQELFGQNPNPAPEEIYQIVGPEKGADILKGMSALQEQNQKLFKSAQELTATALGGVLALPEPLQAQEYGEVRNNLIGRGIAQEADLPEAFDSSVIQQRLIGAMSPEKQYEALNPKPIEVSAGTTLVSPKTNEALFTAPDPRGTETARHNSAMEEIGRMTAGRMEASAAETARHNRVMEGFAQARSGSLFNESVPPEYANALDRAILVLPAARRGPVVALANRLASEGKKEELADVIMQAAIDSENVDTKNQVLGRRATLASLTDTRAILQELKNKGVPTNMLTGSLEDVARRLGTTTNKDYVVLGNRLMGTLINYRRAATGVAFSEKESADYGRMFPNYKNELPVNLALIEGLEREMATYDNAYWTHKLGPEGAKLVGAPGASASASGAPMFHYDPKTGKTY